MHRLDHHDGIVHHDGNGQEQGREHQQVDGEAENPEEEEGTEQGHRNGNHRNQRRAEVLQEHVHHKEHKQQGDDQRENHLLDRREEELGHVHVDLVLQARRERFGLFLQLSLHVGGNLGGVGAGNLLHHTHHRRVAVVLHRHTIVETSQFHLGHILEIEGLTVGIAADDDVSILLGSLQTTLVAHHVLEGHIALLTELTRCGLDILFGQRSRHVGGHHVILLHFVGLQPYTHGVGLHTRRHHATHTVDTLDGGNDVDIVVVGQELIVISSVLRGEGKHDDVRSLLLGDGHTHLGHFGGQECLCL